MDRNMLNPIPLMKGVGLVEHRNTKCIFGGLGGRGGVGAWGGGANNVQLQLHTYLMLCQRHLFLYIRTYKNHTVALTHIHILDAMLETSFIAHTHILPATLETFSLALSHTHTHFFLRQRHLLLHIHTYFMHILPGSLYIYIYIFSCTYPRT